METPSNPTIPEGQSHKNSGSLIPNQKRAGIALAVALTLGAGGAFAYNRMPRSYAERWGITKIDDAIAGGCLRGREVTTYGTELIEKTLSKADQQELFELERAFVCGERESVIKKREDLLNKYNLTGKWWVNTIVDTTCDEDSWTEGVDEGCEPGVYANSFLYTFTYTQKTQTASEKGQ